jgi:hypothetical protein
VIAWFPRPQIRIIAAGPAEPCASEERCWADGPSGQQCAAVIDDNDPLGLCPQHLVALRDGDDPLLGSGTSVVA